MKGRKTGRTRRKCIRAIRRGNRVYITSIRPTAWLKNVRANPDIRLRIRGGTFEGVAREPRDAQEAQDAMSAYCETVNPVDYFACSLHRRGWPTRSKIKQQHRTWFELGIPLVVELEDG